MCKRYVLSYAVRKIVLHFIRLNINFGLVAAYFHFSSFIIHYFLDNVSLNFSKNKFT